MQMRVYTSTMKTSSISAAKTLAYLTTSATALCVLLSAEVVAPDDDTNEQLDIGFQKITTLGTPTKTDVTPTKHNTGDAAADTATAFDVTASEPTYGAANVDVVGRVGASSLGGWRYTPTLAEALCIGVSTSWGLRLFTAPGTAKALTVRLTFGEIE